MTFRLFEAVTAEYATRQFYWYLALAHTAAAVVVAGFGHFTPLAAGVLVLIAVSAGINRWPRYRRSPYALVMSVAVCVYFVLPAVFIAVSGDAYQFGDGINAVPRENADYARAAPAAIAYLAALLFALAAGLGLAAPRRGAGRGALRELQADMPVGVLALIVLVLAQQSTNALLQTRATGDAAAESLWGFIFFDHAYLLLLPVIVSLRLLRPGPVRQLIANWQFALILLLFMLQATVGSTSKGFILTLFVLSFVMPLSFLRSSPSIPCLMPSRSTIIVGLVASVWVFFLAQTLRLATFTGTPLSLGSLAAAAFSRDSGSSLGAMLVVISYRVAVALDRYILLFDAHLHGHSTAYALEFARYLGKNFLNLVLPGTPFPEAYVPSSNLLTSVLFAQPLVGEASKAQLLVELNTQPFTLFGVAIVLGGALAPLGVFALGGTLGVLYRLLRSLPIRLALIYLFNAAIHSYGFEVVLANAIHLGVSIFLFVWMMKLWTLVRRSWRSLRRTDPQAPAVPAR